MIKANYILGGIALLCGIGFAVISSQNNSNKITSIEHTNQEAGPIDGPTHNPQIDAFNKPSSGNFELDKNSKNGFNPNACYEDCQKHLINSALSGSRLSPEEVDYIYDNLDDFVHFLQFNPDAVEKVGIFMATADVGEEGTSDYNEILDANVLLVRAIVDQLPVNDLKWIADTLLLSSDDKVSRQAGLIYIENMLLNLEDEFAISPSEDIGTRSADALETKAELSLLLNNVLYAETDPEIQIEAIQILADYSPEMMSEQIVGLLSGLSTNTANPDIRGQAIELAAASAKPDSLVLTQIEDVLTQSSSPTLQVSSLKALHTSLRRAFKRDDAMMTRLGEFEVHLKELAGNPELDSEISSYAAGLLQDYYAE